MRYWKRLICLVMGHDHVLLGQGTLLGRKGDVTICRRCWLVLFDGAAMPPKVRNDETPTV